MTGMAHSGRHARINKIRYIIHKCTQIIILEKRKNELDLQEIEDQGMNIQKEDSNHKWIELIYYNNTNMYCYKGTHKP